MFLISFLRNIIDYIFDKQHLSGNVNSTHDDDTVEISFNKEDSVKEVVKDVQEVIKDVQEVVKDVQEVVKDVEEMVEDVKEIKKDVSNIIIKDIEEVVEQVVTDAIHNVFQEFIETGDASTDRYL